MNKRYKFIITALLCLSLTGIANAQEKAPQVKQTEPQLEDIYNVLEAMDIHLFRFDLKSFLNNVYKVSIYLDEYQKGESPKRVRNIALGDNIRFIDAVPEEHRQAFREAKQIPEGKNEWEALKELSLYIRKSNDSTAVCTINVPDAMRGGMPLKLKPVEKYNRYAYYPRPFKLQTVKETEHFNVPLLLYGSAWLDKKHDIIRFCGESEIDPEMKAEILQYLPHYYVIGIEFKLKGNQTVR